MSLVKNLSFTFIASSLVLCSTLATAEDNCFKPSIKGFSAHDMTCIGEGLIEVNEYQDAMVVSLTGKTIVPQGKYISVSKFSEGLAGVVDKTIKLAI